MCLDGGSDVWVDIGNKLIGVKVLLGFFNVPPSSALHVGDQFLATGNDIATRSACCKCVCGLIAQVLSGSRLQKRLKKF